MGLLKNKLQKNNVTEENEREYFEHAYLIDTIKGNITRHPIYEVDADLITDENELEFLLLAGFRLVDGKFVRPEYETLEEYILRKKKRIAIENAKY